MSGKPCSKAYKQLKPLARQFALSAVKLKCLLAKHVMSGTLIEHDFLSRVYA